ncbi:MAG: lytic transglycosylase domain-containing protein [Succinivibrionaceae bacterium]
MNRKLIGVFRISFLIYITLSSSNAEVIDNRISTSKAMSTSTFVSTSASNNCKNVHWRDVAYTGVMAKYKPYSHCVQWTANQFELPEELLFSIIYVERGDVNGKCMRNRNGTEDCGPAQINDVRIPEIEKFDLDKSDMKNNPCRNIWAMGYLMRREIEKANGDIWLGVGNYHYHYSVNQSIHDRYVNLVMNAWKKLSSQARVKCE